MLLVATQKIDGSPNLAAKRAVVDEPAEALELAEELDASVYEIEQIVLDPPSPPVRVVRVPETEVNAWLLPIRNVHGADAPRRRGRAA